MTNNEFALRVWSYRHELARFARRLWIDESSREDGVSETILKALANAHRWRGGNLPGWLITIMKNLRRDQYSKGFAKNGKPRPAGGDRLTYAGVARDYAAHIACLCDPESILIALEAA